MAFQIGFIAQHSQPETVAAPTAPQSPTIPRKAVVQVHFPDRNLTLAYYNDQFDLHRGDWVYVDGKLAGLRGRVAEVNYSFKIKLSDYHRVIALVETHVSGQFFLAGSHFVTFDPAALPASHAGTWFRAPLEDEEFIIGTDEATFPLENLNEMGVTAAIAERGHQYYLDNKVRYLCLNGATGYAIVTGTEAYEVEFEYQNGEIRNLTCSCYCSDHCKHEFAVMLQLKETLDRIDKNYGQLYARTGYFAAVDRASFFRFAIDTQEVGSFTLETR